MIHRFSLIAILLVLTPMGQVLAQQVSFPIHIHTGQTIETCSGFFTDSGGDTLTPYQNNETYWLTFTADQDGVEDLFLKFSFLFFELGAGDFLYVYDGEDDTAPLLYQAQGNSLRGEQIWSSGPSLHFRFESSASDTGRGWWAEIECFTLCDAFFTTITSETGSFDFCPDIQEVSFFASTGYYGGNPQGNNANVIYEWNFDGEIKTGATITHTYQEPGAYPFRITATDNINNCQTDTIITVRLATVPDFNGTLATSDTVCAREIFSLIGQANPTTWTGFPTRVDTIAFLYYNEPFESTLDFSVFQDDDQIFTLEDFDRVCIDIEHMDHGHVKFELECPQGNSVLLKNFGLGGAHLGEPVVYRNDIPGIGYEYCFSVSPQLGKLNESAFQFHDYVDQDGNYYFNQPYMQAGNYTSEESLEALAGCPLNGQWTLRVSDNTEATSGYILGWSMYFNEDFYPDSLIFQPEIVSEQWFDSNGNPLTGNPASISREEKGEYAFTFRATDNFGCQWDTTLTLLVLPLPKAEILSALEIPVCEGDSTLLSVEPLNIGDELHWLYQWMLEGAPWDGRTQDTLMAKEPATYMVMVTDTITGCMDIFELVLSTQNCDLTVPNVFTPNNDGINDLFEITNLEYFPGSNMIIYNRHGKKVFEHNDYYGNWWDGGNQPDGTYYYVLSYTRQGKRKQTQGVITIVR